MRKDKKTRTRATFSIKCTSCGETIRENVSEESFGQCLKCFYRSLANWLRTQRRVSAGEFVSDR
jgi:hypothetical protein